MQPTITQQRAYVMTAKDAATHPIAKDIESLSQAGTMQLRSIAKIMHIKNYSKLPREQLIFAILSKKDEMWKQQQMELWQ